ncbi:MAG: hypothetical protein F6K31_27075 [Symploca sp. SIO2G7]|nr:hypothetical protein [Symploca sp. SIO2G7]
MMGSRQNVSVDPESSRYDYSSVRLMPVGAQSVQEQCWGSQVGIAFDSESKGS